MLLVMSVKFTILRNLFTEETKINSSHVLTSSLLPTSILFCLYTQEPSYISIKMLNTNIILLDVQITHFYLKSSVTNSSNFTVTQIVIITFYVVICDLQKCIHSRQMWEHLSINYNVLSICLKYCAIYKVIFNLNILA